MKRNFFLPLLTFLIINACIVPAVMQTPTTEFPATPAAATQTPTVTLTTNYGALARGYIEAITKTIGTRVAGSSEERQTAQYIKDVFERLGYSTEMQPFIAIDDYDETIESANVVAIKPGYSPYEIIIGAHYDSVDAGSGADDNASGVGTMLEVAEHIQNVTTTYTIRFIAFGAEEAGLLGSEAYVAQMSAADIQMTVAMINLDSVGAGDFSYIYSDEGQKAALRDWALNWARQTGLDLQTIRNVDLTDPDSGGCSDYAAFQEAGIPFAYFEATDWNLGDQDGYTQVDPQYGDEGKIWNTKYDTLEYIDANFPGRMNQHLNLVTRVLYNILTQFK